MSRGPARLDLESASNENEGNNGVMVTNEELEESKNGIRIIQRQGNNLGMKSPLGEYEGKMIAFFSRLPSIFSARIISGVSFRFSRRYFIAPPSLWRFSELIIGGLA